MKKTKTDYVERSPADKIKSQWTKLTGHHSKRDWSAAVVRAATSAELATNLVIRAELAKRTVSNEEVLEQLLIAANGINGKMAVIRRLVTEKATRTRLSQLWKPMEDINDKRNKIVHGGHFCGKTEAEGLIGECHAFVQGLVEIWEPSFKLKLPSLTDVGDDGSSDQTASKGKKKS